MVTVPIDGLDSLRPLTSPRPPQCEAATLPTWYRRQGGRCSYRAKYATADGRLLCALHAKKHMSLSETPDG